MRKNEIICAFYNPEVERFDKYHSFMKVVVENQKRIAPLYFENDDGKYLIVFYRRKLKKLIKLLQDEALDFYEKIMSGKYRHCAQCGCGYLSYMPVTYRRGDGCLACNPYGTWLAVRRRRNGNLYHYMARLDRNCPLCDYALLRLPC